MLLGYRIRSENEIGLCELKLTQISLWRNSRSTLDYTRELAKICQDQGIRYVIHPLPLQSVQLLPLSAGYVHLILDSAPFHVRLSWQSINSYGYPPQLTTGC